MNKKAVTGLFIVAVGLAIAKNGPEIMAEKIKTAVNSMRLSHRVAIAWRVLFAKL